MAQLVELETSMKNLRELAEVFVINVDTPGKSRRLKKGTGISVPVLLDNGLKVSQKYDMHSRPGLPMGGMRGIPTMGFVIFDGKGIIQTQRAHMYFGRDAEYIMRVLQRL